VLCDIAHLRWRGQAQLCQHLKRIISIDTRVAVEYLLDRISFGLSALGIALLQRISLPMTVTLVSFSSQSAGMSC
jgi:hypothetical protein